jgi:uncharacterized protein YndB with AHSA1/START domain
VERIFDASPGQVWHAITDPDAMKQWYFDLPGFQPTVGYEFTFNGRNKDRIYVHLCRVTEVIPGQKIAYTWKYDGDPGMSTVTWELEPVGNKTRLRLTHEGLHTFPQTGDYARTNFEAGWDHFINRTLEEYLSKQ